MASPAFMGGSIGSGWAGPAADQQVTGQALNAGEEMGMEVRAMGLKVHYTLDEDSGNNFLARGSQHLPVRTIPIDERNWIGIIDLHSCVQAIAGHSPEIVARNDYDYTIYAVDYSEPDTPLVGQGMLSWSMEAPSQPSDEYAKMVTGRVTKNLLSLFGNGPRETLEVRFKLAKVPRITRPDGNGNADYGQQQARSAATPTDTNEWNSFIQSNPSFGRSANVGTVPTSNLAPAGSEMSGLHASSMPATAPQSASYDITRPMSQTASRAGSRPVSRQSLAPSHPPTKSALPMYGMKPTVSSNAGSPPPSSLANDDPTYTSMHRAEPSGPRDGASRPSRPSSRASRSRVPTGRPRGRPRKKPPVDGNTSAAEELPTDADVDDGPKKKRAKITKADYPLKASLDMPPDSLRVAASTSGAIRNFRPIMAAPHPGNEGSGAASSHLQEYPRAPTPVPQGLPPSQQHARKMMAQKARRESLADLDGGLSPDSVYNHAETFRSPADSFAPSPENYTPEAEDSPVDISSSPPVPRPASYVARSSPMPSSPILPPMPRPQPDSGFMSGGFDDVVDDEDCMNGMGNGLAGGQSQQTEPQGLPAAPKGDTFLKNSSSRDSLPQQAAPTNANQARSSKTATQPAGGKNAQQSGQFSFMAINPGPPELLPVSSIYDPPRPKARPPPRTSTTGSAAATLKRSHSEPSQASQHQHHQQQPSQRQGGTQYMQQPMQPQQHVSQSSLPADSEQMAEALPTEAQTFPVDDSASQAEAAPAPATQTGQAGLFDDADELTKLMELQNVPQSADNSTAEAAAEVALSPQHQLTLPQPANSRISFGARHTVTTVPASDPPALPPLTLPSLPPAPTAFSEAPCPPSDSEPTAGRSKNLVRKAAIRERLQKAIESGEMPPFCQNCGAIETPTWRKMWTQDHEGEPGFHSYSEKPGQVTAIDVLERNEDGKPTKYRLVKKALGPTENSKLWTQMLLCNPCGIWLGKFKSHRPSDRWDKDASRLNQPKKKRSSGSRSRKSRAKSESQLQPTSEAYFTTDPAGPFESEDITIVGGSLHSAPSAEDANGSRAELRTAALGDSAPSGSHGFSLALPAMTGGSASNSVATEATANQTEAAQSLPKRMVKQSAFQAGSNPEPAFLGGEGSQPPGPGSTHSRGSGTVHSPISVDDHFGTTRRLLFPSPRKDGALKVLGELAVNSVTTATLKADCPMQDMGVKVTEQGEHCEGKDDMVDLFGTPPPAARLSTPPPRSSGNRDHSEILNGPFKTPTRQTPSHRPITRSISKSIRTATSHPSDGLLELQRTPSKTPRQDRTSSTKRRNEATTPNRQGLGSGFHAHNYLTLESPFTSTLNQLLSEANEFTTGSPSHGLIDLNMTDISHLGNEGMSGTFHTSASIDFGSYLSTDMEMPSSSPLAGRKTAAGSRHHVTFGEALHLGSSESIWSEFGHHLQDSLGDDIRLS